MPTEAKRETVAELREALAGSRTLIVSEYRGLTIATTMGPGIRVDLPAILAAAAA